MTLANFLGGCRGGAAPPHNDNVAKKIFALPRFFYLQKFFSRLAFVTRNSEIKNPHSLAKSAVARRVAKRPASAVLDGQAQPALDNARIDSLVATAFFTGDKS